MLHRSWMLAATVLVLAAGQGFAQLPQELKVTQLQGGFAGFTGVRITIATDGAWTTEDLFNQKSTPKARGRLSEANLDTLTKLLAKVEAAKLPAQSGRAPGANPFTLTIEMGKTKAAWTGASPPKNRPDSPNESVEARFGAIWETVRAMAKPPKP